jgi:DNA-binding response OmpR family regulator
LKILIAEDDRVSRHLLAATLKQWGYEPVVTCDGLEALAGLQAPDAPPLAILDWMMPGLDGVQVIRAVRQMVTATPPYIILLTAKSEQQDIVNALEAGADDYLTKPFHREELGARVRAGLRIVELQLSLAARVHELEESLNNVKTLQGMLPICSYCKKIRDDQNYWQRVEHYISDHSEAQFSHGVCPDCYETAVKPEILKLRQQIADENALADCH